MGAGTRSIPTAPKSRPNLVIDSYEQHYFSGNQCRVYLDGVYVSDINYIEYSIVSNKAPIYSYNDPYYKLVARGNYLVQGNFNINLTERNKLIKIKDELRVRKARIQSTEFDISALRTDNDILKYFSAANDIDQSELIGKYMEVYWNTNTDGPIHYLRPDEWDLDRNMDIDPDGFDIVMVFGVPGGPQNRYTVKQINNVHVTGESMVIQEGGQPMIEQYSFFARKIDGEKSTYYPHEDKLGAPEEMRVDTDLSGYPIKVTGKSHWIDKPSYWGAIFTFDTADDKVSIRDISVGRPMYKLMSEPNAYPVDIFEKKIDPNDLYGTTVEIAVYDIPQNAGWVELRNVTLVLSHSGKEIPIYTTGSIGAISELNNSIRVRRPTQDGLPPAVYQ